MASAHMPMLFLTTTPPRFPLTYLTAAIIGPDLPALRHHLHRLHNLMQTAACCSAECSLWMVPTDPRRHMVRVYERELGIPDRHDLRAYSVWGIWQVDECLREKRALDAESILNGYIACMEWVGDETKATVRAMAAVMNEVLAPCDLTGLCQPQHLPRPFVGYKRRLRQLRKRLRVCMRWMDRRVSPPPEWSLGPVVWPGHMHELLDQYQPPAELLRLAWLKAHLLCDVLRVHARAMLTEFTAWRRLPCAMVLHARLGAASPLAVLDADLVQLVLGFA